VKIGNRYNKTRRKWHRETSGWRLLLANSEGSHVERCPLLKIPVFWDEAPCQPVELTFWHRSFTFNSNKSSTWCNSFQFIILTFVYSSTCFGRFPAHHRELNDCSGSLWFYLRIVVTVVLCSWSGRPAGPTTNTAHTLSSWWWAGKRLKHVELWTNVRIINWKIVASDWWFVWIKCKTPVPKC
jgi:hypothetical protein